ncbi:uncharacterized protein LOC143282826 [Babylonia areolata]|uniref:uncharacterized protein LOC143282826 n=1 Tax=Babylonia areolata TaxID=304850 RepID=UPI003FD4EDA8
MEQLGMDGGYKEEEAADMMDKDELEELLGLQVQFGDAPSSLPVVPFKDAAGQQHEEEVHSNLRPARNSQATDEFVCVDIGGEAFRMWSDVGAAEGLNSDPEIATFLLQHYENTKCIMLPSGGNCTVCNQPLSLVCSQCSNRPAHNLSSPSSTYAVCASETDPHRNGKMVQETLCEMTTGTARKRITLPKARKKKKKRKGKGVLIAASVVDLGSCDDGDGDDYSRGDYESGVVNDGNTVDSQGGSKTRSTKIDEKKEQVQAESASFTKIMQAAKHHGDQSKKQRRKHTSKPPTGGQVGEDGGKMFRCMVCSRSYTRACSLKAHMRKHTGEKPFKCKRCDAAFSLSGSLIVHLRTHTGDKPFVCDECGHKFAISNALKQHKRQHTGEKPYHCKICFSKYSRSDSLKVHMRTHSGDRPFICEICGADFSRLYCLIAHKKKHSGERPFKCSECPASFVQSGKLTIHMRKHTGDRPFQCEQCGASFTQSERLKTHLRIHSGEKPYRCGECGKGFSHPHSLKVHGRVHTGDKPYKCGVCSLTFADPSYFRRHKAKHANSADVPAGAATTTVTTTTTTTSCDPLCSVPGYLDPSGDFSVPLSGTDNHLNAFQAAGVTLSSSAPSMITAGFPETSASADTLGGVDCFSEATAGFSIPLSSSLPSLGFSVPGSVGLGFSMPPVMNATAEGTDAVPSVNSADPFAFLRTALHCPGSYPS